MAGDQGLRHLLEIELQAAGKNRHRNLLRVGGRQNEFHVLRGFFEGLQHGVERRRREHVHLVDDIDLEATAGRRIDGVLEQLPHLIDTRIGRRVDLEEVDETSRIDFQTRRAGAAGRRADAGFAIQCLRQDPRERRLADAACAGKQIGMMQPLFRQCVSERANHMLLANQIGESSRAPLARQDLVTHGTDSSRWGKRPRWSFSGSATEGAGRGGAHKALRIAAMTGPWKGGEPYPRHSHETAVAASFRT